MNRRDFLKNIGMAAIGVPFLLNDLKVQAMNSFLSVSTQAEDRVLILIRLNGGNDGLNTVIPIDQMGNLSIQRPNILIPETSILKVSNTIGFHPSMMGMQNMFNNGNLGIIQNVGYPEQNRSHFRSMDIWSSGLINEPAITGWLGRKFQIDHPEFPEKYPTTEVPHPFAISMGNSVSSTCQGTEANFGHTVKDPTQEYDLGQGDFIHDGSCHSDHLEYINVLINQTNKYGAELNKAAAAGNTLSELYDEENDLAVHLRNVARLISGGLKTSVYVLNINGFDTHADQVQSGSTTTGEHADLLKTLSDGIHAFQDDLKLLGLEDRVMGMTFSEFGRQIASNASYGTDHGDAAPLFLFGNCLASSVIGNNPTIPDVVVKQEALPIAVDFRDVYASVLNEWFGIPQNEIIPLFEHDVTFLQLLTCSAVTSSQTNTQNKAKSQLYPNPSTTQTTLQFESADEWVKVSIMDMQGNEILVPIDKNLNQSIHKIKLDITDLSEGQYLIRILKESGSESIKLTKI